MKRAFIMINFIFSFAMVFGQEVKVESSTEEMDSTKFSALLVTYNRIVMAKREELALFKVDLLGPLLFSLSGNDSTVNNIIRISFEQKIKPQWSWLVAVEAAANKNDITETRLRGGARYYFNMQKRILKSKSANNFSANYVSTRLNYKTRQLDNENQVSLDLLFGMQRRLWKYGYVDFDVGLENIIHPFSNEDSGIDFTSSIQLGIAF